MLHWLINVENVLFQIQLLVQCIYTQHFNSCNDGDETGETGMNWISMCACVHLCAISGKALVIFGHGRRAAVTACGLRTEDPVFFLERGKREEWRVWGGGWGIVYCGCPVTLRPVYDLLLGYWMSEALKSTSRHLFGSDFVSQLISVVK